MKDEDISVVLVDQDDNILGYGDKLDVHRKGLLHRAFSVLLFNEHGELLIQQRAPVKYHAPLKWANTTCGHPFPGEDPQDAAIRRTREELGIDVEVEPLTHIYYKKGLEHGMIEHEYVHVFKSIYTGQKLSPDPVEVATTEWMLPEDIKMDHVRNPDKYAAWFAHYIEDYYEQLFSA